jgi:two-component system, NarL family, invasion response regulator UvrY
MTKILVADNHPSVRIGVKQICLNSFPSLKFGEAINYAEVFQRFKETKWDILILDIDMPGRNGLDILRQMKIDKIRTPVLVFSFHNEEQIAIRTLKAGAAGYLSKDANDTELIKAINAVIEGKKYISQSVSEKMFFMLNNNGKEPHELLSNREYQILLLFGSGKSLSDIAQTLFLSKNTICTYRSRLLLKMNLSTNADLMNYALSQNLV